MIVGLSNRRGPSPCPTQVSSVLVLGSIGLRGAMLGLGLALGLGSGLAHAVEVGSGTQSTGLWDLKLDNGSRQCRVNLRSEPLGPGYAVAMPVGCHRAFPVLESVAIWSEAGEGKLQFEDRAGQPVLTFEPGGRNSLAATSPEGEIYRLEPVGLHRAMLLKVAAKTDTAAPAGAKAAAKPAAGKPAQPSAAEMSGHYAVLRDKTKDTGCMVTFDDKAHGPKGSFKAHLAPACRDQGIVIFDPVGWQLKGGRLVLTARKGHTTKLDLQDDGSWMKDPTEGKSLSLKKMQ